MASQIITLTSDFGYRDPFVGIMKGVMLRINPAAILVDLTHGIEPQDIMAGALGLVASIPYFPPGTVHLAVVDPGVGSSRKPIAIETDKAFYVGPDNGVLSLAARASHVIRTVELSNTACHLQPTSSTFHGRDIFSPVAAHLSARKPVLDLGPPMEAFTELDWPPVERRGKSLYGQVIYIDHFGNLISNIRGNELETRPDDLSIMVHETTIVGLSTSYSSAGHGEYLGIINSWGLLEISKCNGNAQLGLGAQVGSTVSITPVL